MAPQTQKALLVTEIGKPLVLSTTHPIPQPGPTQLQIRVTVAGFNPHDQNMRDTGLLIADSLPNILGHDVVGVVTALGSNVDPSRFAINDRVFSQSLIAEPTQAGLQQYAVLDADFTAKVPDNISEDDAAELPTNTVTNACALFDSTLLGFPAPWSSDTSNVSLEDTTILIVGGGSNTGRFAVQFAALAGFGRIVVIGGEEAQLKSYGATRVLDRHGSDEEVLTRIRDVVGDDLLYAIDTINMPDKLHTAINALSNTKRGQLARLVPVGEPDESKIHEKKEGYELLSVFGHPRVRQEVGKPFWAYLPQLLREGKVKPTKSVVVVREGLDADQVNAVLDAYRDGKRVVKTHVHI